ncbi:MAG TPA: hypothetical protein DIW46_09225 [Microbacterium sp.]|uniref:hypothetical protein n=1 Tax=Microbacterium sp. TaxID=51671 RepID=UPI000EC4DE81|nr:hypothetical protein [Microbacterium sp.]
MIFSFIVYVVLFLGGVLMMGLSFEVAGFEALVFCGGLVAFCLSLAWIMRQSGSATRRANNWDGGPGAN